MNWTKVDSEVALEVASHEAVIRQTYIDSVGINTWSVGLTDATGHDVDRYIGKPQPLQHCMDIYVWALDNYADQVRDTFKGYNLTKAQFTAALSFHWNTGAIRRASWVKSFKRGDMARAEREIMNWVTPKEITKRRERERELFFRGKWHNNGKMLEYTQLYSNRSPKWSSAKWIDVKHEIELAFFGRGKPIPVVVDKAPQPNKKPAAPTTSNPGDIMTAIVAFLNAIFKRG